MTNLARIWQSRRMSDYTQHLPMNCGGVAAIFALYGPSGQVPWEMDEQLSRQSLPGMQIVYIINKAGVNGIQAKFYSAGSQIPITDYSGPGATRPEPVEFLEGLDGELFIEGIRDILVANNARCVIVSGANDRGYHWQTYYVPVGSESVEGYNTRKGWRPVLGGGATGTPTGIVLVSGPRMQR